MQTFLVTAGVGTLVGAVAAFFLGATLVGLVIGYALERGVPNRRIWSDPIPAGQLRHEAIGNIIFLTVTIASFTAVLASRLVRFGPDTWARGTLTFVALFFGFQAYFYFLHRALHLPSLVRFHRYHHVSRITTPLSGQSTSLGEAIGWMGGYVIMPVLFSRVAPFSAEGFAWYMAFNVIGNIVGHANVEVIPASPGLRTRSLLATVFTYHALHHLRWTGHYGFASTWLDRLLGTEWPDWLTLHARVAAGHPLSLSTARKVEGQDNALTRSGRGAAPPGA